jgi:hypothetical protein
VVGGGGWPRQRDEAAEQLVDLVGGGLVVGATPTDRVSDVVGVVVPHAEQVVASPAGGDAREPLAERLTDPTAAARLRQPHELLQREAAIDRRRLEDGDLAHVLPRHGDHDVGLPQQLGRRLPAAVGAEVEPPRCHGGDAMVGGRSPTFVEAG